MTKAKAIETVEFLKKINIYKEKGMSIAEVVKAGAGKTTNLWQSVEQAFKKIDISMSAIKIIDNLTKDEINDAILKYRKGVPLFEIIEGVKGELPLAYFSQMHITDSDKSSRNNFRKKIKRQSELALNPKKVKEPKPIIERIPEPVKPPVKELWDFSDENIVETKRPALVQFHGKTSGLGYGCAANMCAEK
jgi:hypothetical protein